MFRHQNPFDALDQQVDDLDVDLLNSSSVVGRHDNRLVAERSDGTTLPPQQAHDGQLLRPGSFRCGHDVPAVA
jgi:hypothetical protein